MEAYVVDWLNLLARWLHFVAGIAWIGSSFYFIWLDNHLEAPAEDKDREAGVGGEVWAVHGGKPVVAHIAVTSATGPVKDSIKSRG